MNSLTIWKHMDIGISELALPVDGFEYHLKTQGQYIFISELSFGGFIYQLKIQGLYQWITSVI